ncbi:ParA family protein [Aggregatibacter actinomycetemcomitans]|uniref:ParA family protein n=2 Tax=Aggregatibacter actinomycetemcomitans TaxID=714 RepID=UPI00077E6B35|nr:ParA family protein [Aggregatibacter actinomycetemcomitans]KYK88958.1 ATPase [Aggregatibacter actinomycetemcomitans serotype f str. SC29R]MBN6061091.1 ParA family protein [Aggregatibacter actinomycetemcomitans]OZV16822.1 ParA family protein [Aggregatibacter actinomycetemcomitans]UEL52756.1 ParA family protein [Aggregatibacter actinomycetemcomitans]
MNKKYLVWNNKGGVGKTFLTYSLSVEYAIKHPDEDVIVIDACPQSNVSEIILGGNGTGEANLDQFRETERTIAGYIKERFRKSQLSKIGNEYTYFVKADSMNKEMPDNLYLLPGDIDLDICSKLIAYIGSSPVTGAWKASRSLLVDLIEAFESNKDSENRSKTFFIDCNPSFANYTELAVLAANRIIVPCTADAASIRGIKNLIKLIYGISVDNKTMEDEYLNFSNEVKSYKLKEPLLHIFIQNRSRTNERDATKAFRSHAEEIQRITNNLTSKHPNLFTQSKNNSKVINVKDRNTLAAIINHEGCPISKLQHKRYTIYGKKTQANQDQIAALLADINSVVDYL